MSSSSYDCSILSRTDNVSTHTRSLTHTTHLRGVPRSITVADRGSCCATGAASRFLSRGSHTWTRSEYVRGGENSASTRWVILREMNVALTRCLNCPLVLPITSIWDVLFPPDFL